MVDRVGIVLRLETVETERVARRLGAERAGVELHARLGRPRFHDTTRAGLNGAGGDANKETPEAKAVALELEPGSACEPDADHNGMPAKTKLICDSATANLWC